MPRPMMHGGLRREDIEAAFGGQETPELQRLAERLAKDSAYLEQTLRELQAHQQALRQDNAGLRKTIETVIGRLKSSVSAQSLPETRQPENPLDALGRFWERVRPRNPGILVSEHIGELRWPAARGAEGPAAAVPPPGQRASERLAGALGLPTWKLGGAAALWGAASVDGPKPSKPGVVQPPARASRTPRGKAADGAGGDGAIFGPLFTFLGGGGGQSSTPTSARGSGGPLSPKVPRGASSGTESTEEGSTPATSVASTARGQGRLSFEEDALRSQIEEALARPAADGDRARDEAEGPAAEEPSGRSGAAPPEAPAAAVSVLIEATLTLDEVVLAVCRVHATDRCAEVAARFIEEHSLKPCFKAPLTAWLKQAEADAETFPLLLEADLMDIRNSYGPIGA